MSPIKRAARAIIGLRSDPLAETKSRLLNWGRSARKGHLAILCALQVGEPPAFKWYDSSGYADGALEGMADRRDPKPAPPDEWDADAIDDAIQQLPRAAKFVLIRRYVKGETVARLEVDAAVRSLQDVL